MNETKVIWADGSNRFYYRNARLLFPEGYRYVIQSTQTRHASKELALKYFETLAITTIFNWFIKHG